MPIANSVLRNLRHPANSGTTCFDDLQISTIATLFQQNRELYHTCPSSFAKQVHAYAIEKLLVDKDGNPTKHSFAKAKTELLGGLKDSSGQSLYTGADRITVKDVEELLQYLAKTSPINLQSWSSLLEPHFRLQVYKASVKHVIKPKIEECMFCKIPLDAYIVTTKAGGKAPGGHSWAYTLGTGGGIAAVCQKKCSKCQTKYDLQTYNPGERLMDNQGM